MARIKISGCLKNDGEEGTQETTLPIPVPVAFTKIEGEYTLLDAKLWLLLLHLSWDELLTHSKIGVWHEISESELIAIFTNHTGTKDVEKLWNSGRRLASTIVEYQRIDENDERWMGISTMFFCEYKPKQKRDGMFRYMFPAPLVDIFLEPKIYARLRLFFIFQLKSKYSVRLYQLLESVSNLNNSRLDIRVDELREFLNVPKGKLSSWSEFCRFALLPAIHEINSNPEISWLLVDHELIRKGRGGKVQRVVFNVTKTQDRISFEQQIGSKKKGEAELFFLPKSDESTSKIDDKEKDAIALAIYFYEKKNGNKVKKSDISKEDIIEIKKLIDELQSSEKVKRFITLALDTKNPPQFIGGLKFHRSRVLPLLRNEEGLRQQNEQSQSMAQRKNERETQEYKEFLRYYETLSRKDIDRIIEKTDLDRLEKTIVQKNTLAGESIRKQKVFEEWQKLRNRDAVQSVSSY